MITTRATLIRVGRRTRMYRPYVRFGQWTTLTYTVMDGVPMCWRCGCTEQLGCWDGCGWADEARTVCSRCIERMAR